MLKKITKNLIIFILLAAGLLAARLVLAQDFGTAAVNNGLGGSLSAGDPREIAGRIINIALGFLGVVAIGFIIYAGFIWMTSAGQEEKIETAKKILKSGVIGLVIILASWGIATFIISRLSGAVDGSGGTYQDGDTSSCGCGGSMVYSGGSWSACVGSDCSGGPGGIGNESPSSCDSGPEAGCQAVAQICAPDDYCDSADCGCKPRGGLGAACDANLNNEGVCDADNNRCAEYLTCNPDSCLCYGPPVITEISPLGGFCTDNRNKSCDTDSDCDDVCDRMTPNGAANNFITIFGKNFGEYLAGSSQVLFVGAGNAVAGVQPSELNASCVNFWRDDQIIMAVPAGASTGPIQVINRDNLSDSTADSYGPSLPDFQTNNIVRPGLCYLNPNRGALSSEVGYQGINLYSSAAYFGNYQSNVRAIESIFTNPAGLNGTSTTPNIRAGESGSFVQGNLNGHQESSNYLRFVKESEPGAGPFISSFSPVSGNAGQYVTIRGQGFGGARGLSRVYFGETEASYDFPDMCLNSVWKDNQIIVKVPPGLANDSQPIKINLNQTVIDTVELNPNTFRGDQNTVLLPSLCKIEPLSGPAATPVTLWGEYFGRVNDEGLVKFNYDKNAIGAIQTEGRANIIKTIVPVGAISGPVTVVNNGQAGNVVNFTVEECRADADCGTQVCCPQNTYRKGRCVDSLNDCFVDVPTSVFEWKFSTGFGTSIINPYAYSCTGLSRYYGDCQDGDACPNVPGACSTCVATERAIADCDYGCSSIPGCGGLGGDNCSYDETVNKCVKNGVGGTCDLEKTVTFNDQDYQAACTLINEVPTPGKYWVTTTAASCPSDWVRVSANKCVDLSANCEICAEEFSCEKINQTDIQGRCVSEKICPDGAICKDQLLGEVDKCMAPQAARCDCCCTIGQSARDCCGGLQCEGTCGSDVSLTDGANNTNSGFGRCGGCASAGAALTGKEAVDARDAACNCSGHSGQYCEIEDEKFADGVCTDCSGLSGSECLAHSDVCCLDARGTEDANDDVCRGGDGTAVSPDVNNPNYGYCAYYDCSADNSNQCAETSPVKIGAYADKTECAEECPKNNPCDGLTDLTQCRANSRCCFDSLKTATVDDDICRSGNQIAEEFNDAGYCTYYDCSVSDPNQCASTTPVKGTEISFDTIGSCVKSCENPPSGAGLRCVASTTSLCDASVCNLTGFGCFSPEGTLGGASSDCGTCCCQPGVGITVFDETNLEEIFYDDACKLVNEKFRCEPNKGSCSGANRGLCCGCDSDLECGSPETIGCGLDTCCQARPNVLATSPAHLADKVCRNAALQVTFNQEMDTSSFVGNVLLLEERNYTDGVCPAGTFVAAADSLSEVLAKNNIGQNNIDRNWLGRLIGRLNNYLANRLTNSLNNRLPDRLADRVTSIIAKLFGQLGGSALADIPDPDKLYCAVPGNVHGENSGQTNSLVFTPQRLLAPDANYYLVLKGDAELNSRSGLLSAAGIGLNSLGYFDPAASGGDGAYVPSANITFNQRRYNNSHIIKFTTLSSQGATAGICAIDNVAVSPASYLFKTADNSLDENDMDPVNNKTFDTKADGDKVFTAWAYSADGQILKPVTGYYWDWQFQVADSSVVSAPTISGLADNQIFIEAKADVTDDETKLTATIDMSRFSTANSCNTNTNCVCEGENCSNDCCNFYSGGDEFNKAANIYVFLCNNPWPPVASNGQWSPWIDTCEGASNCGNYNYKFYYCRDAGAAGTLDDLPAIADQAVILGSSSNFSCSANGVSCVYDANGDNLPDVCGPDKNGDGSPDGLCLWNVLKESYFFRETLPAGGEIREAINQKTGGDVSIAWNSSANQVLAYKIYYSAGQGVMSFKEVKAADACVLSNDSYDCRTTIDGLANGSAYVFKVSVISSNRTESALSNEKSATPTDETLPSAPLNLRSPASDSVFKFSWSANTDDTDFYRLYYGVAPGAYGQSVDSADAATGLSLPIDRLPFGDSYFALSAIDDDKNESVKSAELRCNISLKKEARCTDVNVSECLIAGCCSNLYQIAAWESKVNQHFNEANCQWETDPDGSSGSNLITASPLNYCRKFYPQTVSATAGGQELITTWREAGNTGGPFSRTVPVVRCNQP